MRKLVLSMNMTLDGFMAGSNSELDWHFKSWTDEMARYASEQLSHADTILLGRVTYQAMANYWPNEPLTVSYPREDIPFADMMNNYTKIVFSRSLQKTEWHNSKLVKDNIREQIIKLKKKKGKDIIVYGSGKIASALIKLKLIDEFVLWMHPVVLGSGKPLFRGIHDDITLKLNDTKVFASGVVVLCYSIEHETKYHSY
jgi:dihydrofolate reductase